METLKKNWLGIMIGVIVSCLGCFLLVYAINDYFYNLALKIN